MDFLNKSNGSDISYLLDVSASLSLSDDDDQVNEIGLGVRNALNRAGGLGRVHCDGGGRHDKISRAGGLGRVHCDGGEGRDEISHAGGLGVL